MGSQLDKLGEEVLKLASLPALASSIPWAEWKARELNRLFHEHGIAGSVSAIRASTVRHGERA